MSIRREDRAIINLANAWAFAQAERRLTFRLFRYWGFNVLAFILCTVLYLYYSVIHGFGSPTSASIGAVGPRYIVGAIGLFFLVVFNLGVIFLAFDVRARDARERMLEVLDSRPYNNLDLVVGRFIGLFLMMWVPVLVLVGLLVGLGALLPAMGAPIGGPIEPYSLLGFAFMAAIPALAFSCALVIFITLLVRNRMVAMVLSAALIIGLYAVSLRITPYAPSLGFDLLGLQQMAMPSDWVPAMSQDFWGWTQRIGLLLLALGLLVFAALLHPRLESGARSNNLVVAGLFSLVGLGLMLNVMGQRAAQLSTSSEWLAAHQSAKSAPLADIQTITANVELEPGSGLTATVSLTLTSQQQLNSSVFSLNPGFTISKVTGNGGDLAHQFEQGLLTVNFNPPLAAGQTQQITIEYSGKPDSDFGYLDSHFDYRTAKFEQADATLLGIDNGIFSTGYVALMPGNYWLPSAGSDVARSAGEVRKRDFYQLDLSIKAPSNWTVAGPGKRDVNAGVVRFTPKVALSQVAVMAAPFERFATTVEGIEFEVLMHPEHLTSMAYFDAGKPAIESWLKDKVALGKQMGFEYPFESFSLVEVPNSLRSYGGGFAMASTFSAPGLMLMKETGLPTAKFKLDEQTQASSTDPDGPANKVREQLVNFFASDFSGGNLFAGAADSHFGHLTGAKGPDALALEYSLDQLAALVLSDQRSYFAVARIADLGQTMTTIVTTPRKPGDRLSDLVIDAVVSAPQVWEGALATSFDQFDPWKNPNLSTDVLALKAGGAAQLIYDMLGVQKSGQLLAAIKNNHAGQFYTRADVKAAAIAIEPELGLLFDDWFTNAGLAGFSTRNVELYQLPDNRNGDKQYQLKLTLANDEQTTGYARVAWQIEEDGLPSFSKPIRIAGRSAVEFGIILSTPALSVSVDPYVSHNRGEFLAKRFNLSQIANKEDAPFIGLREVDWTQNGNQGDRIIVDDLDSGFSYSGTAVTVEDGQLNTFDQGLPLTQLETITNRWSRIADQGAWGRYRRTMAMIGPGDGSQTATLTTSVAKADRYALEVYFPDIAPVSSKLLGNWTINVYGANSHDRVNFDTAKAGAGWYKVGEFELAKGEVKVEFSNQTQGMGVIVDAIAWSALE